MIRDTGDHTELPTADSDLTGSAGPAYRHLTDGAPTHGAAPAIDLPRRLIDISPRYRSTGPGIGPWLLRLRPDELDLPRRIDAQTDMRADDVVNQHADISSYLECLSDQAINAQPLWAIEVRIRSLKHDRLPLDIQNFKNEIVADADRFADPSS